jgi:hypothetical protein
MNIILCIPGRTFSNRFLQSYTATMAHLIRKGYQVSLSNCYSSNVYYARAGCLGAHNLRGPKQKPFDGKVKYDYLVWIDSDIVWDPRQIDQLLTVHPVYSGLYLQEDNVSFTAVKDWDEEYFKKNGKFEFLTKDTFKNNKNPVAVDYVGMGFIALKYGVVEQIDYPWFRPITYNIGNTVDFCSEDVGFCHLLREKDIKILVDPKIIVGHEKMKVLV